MIEKQQQLQEQVSSLKDLLAQQESGFAAQRTALHSQVI